MMRWWYDPYFMAWKREDGASIHDEKVFNLERPLRDFVKEAMDTLCRDGNARLGNSVLAALDIHV